VSRNSGLRGDQERERLTVPPGSGLADIVGVISTVRNGLLDAVGEALRAKVGEHAVKLVSESSDERLSELAVDPFPSRHSQEGLGDGFVLPKIDDRLQNPRTLPLGGGITK
jgi:hypothetical protein